MILRPYQQAAVDAACARLRTDRSTVLVLPVGTGKTVVFSHIAHTLSTKRTLVLAHRRELVHQAADKLRLVTGRQPCIEMAMERAINTPLATSMVVSSIQTQAKRKGKFNPHDFDLIILDECHHAVAKSYRSVIDHYRSANPDIMVLGVTATPKRADNVALGSVFSTVAYELPMLEAIREGWLCPIESRTVKDVEVDFSQVSTVAGDFNQGELGKIMEHERPIHRVAATIRDLVGTRKCITFTVTVEQARMVTEVVRRYGIAAEVVSGKTPTKERDAILAKYRTGEVTCLVNCNVFTEGFDAPETAAIVLARPTKSVGAFTQMVGRGLRPLPGVVDGVDHSFDRVLAINSSTKPHCDVIDFTGTMGKHKLVRCVDILGGKWSDAVKAKVARRAEGDEPVSLIAALDDERREELEAVKRRNVRKLAQVIGVPKYKLEKVDLFGKHQTPPGVNHSKYTGNLATDAQVAALRRMGYPISPGMTKKRAGQILSELIQSRKNSPPTVNQQRVLSRHGLSARTFSEASAMIDRLKKNNWKAVTA